MTEHFGWPLGRDIGGGRGLWHLVMPKSKGRPTVIDEYAGRPGSRMRDRSRTQDYVIPFSPLVNDTWIAVFILAVPLISLFLPLPNPLGEVQFVAVFNPILETTDISTSSRKIPSLRRCQV